MYFVVFVIYCYSVDATKTDALCRFVSDSPAKSSNCKMKICCFFDSPCLCFFAKTDIELGKELRYDYGDDENMCFYECFTFPRILIALYYFQRVSWNSLEKRESFCMCFYVKMDDLLFVFFVCLIFFLVLLFLCKLFDETKFILLLRTFRLLQQSSQGLDFEWKIYILFYGNE